MTARRTRSAALLLAGAALLAIAASTPARADTVTDWNQQATDALIVTAGQGPTVSVLHLAMVHGAVYDAVNAIDGRHEPYLGAPRARSWYSKDAAAATAAYRVLVSIVPAQQAALEARYQASLAAIPEGKAKAGGIAVGEASAAQMIAARTGDGRFGPFRFLVGSEPGQWRPVLPAFVNDPNAWVAQVRPFLIDSPAQFRSDGPNALDSKRYAREFAEVKSIGSLNSTTRTADQTDMARFWAENALAMWSRVFRQLSAGHSLGTAENSRFFAMMYLTAADAAISCWDDKAHWGFWRPITAIREADTDGNPATDADPELAAAARHAAVPGSSLRARVRERLDRGVAARLLRHRPGRVQRDQRNLRHDEELHPLLTGDRGDHRRPRLLRNPLPERRRAGRPDRQAGGPLAGAALLRARRCR